MEIYAAPIAVQQKTDASPVTAADLAAHRLIVPALQQLTPDIPVISEEDPINFSERFNWPRYWLVDPLDGTKEFIQRNDEFTVNIALIDAHRPVLGVITAPALQQRYWGITTNEQQAAWMQIGKQPSQPIMVRHTPEQPIALVSRSHPDSRLDNWLATLSASGQPFTTQAMGSSLKLTQIAAGTAAVYARFGPTSEWDIAAGHAILAAAGGQVLTASGQSLRYGQPQPHHQHAADMLNPSFIAIGGTPTEASPAVTWLASFANLVTHETAAP